MFNPAEPSLRLEVDPGDQVNPRKVSSGKNSSSTSRTGSSQRNRFAKNKPKPKKQNNQEISGTLSPMPAQYDMSVLTDGPHSLPAMSLSGFQSPGSGLSGPSQTRRLPVYTANGKMPHHRPNRPNSGHAECQVHGSPLSPSVHSPMYSIELSPSSNIKMSPKSSRSSSLKSTPVTPKAKRGGFDRRSQHSFSNGQRNGRSNMKPNFDEYMPLSDVQKALKKGEIVEGLLRINPRNFEDAYINSPDEATDICISSANDRNRALNGDRVAVKLKPTSEWRVSYHTITTHWHKWKDQCTTPFNVVETIVEIEVEETKEGSSNIESVEVTLEETREGSPIVESVEVAVEETKEGSPIVDFVESNEVLFVQPTPESKKNEKLAENTAKKVRRRHRKNNKKVQPIEEPVKDLPEPEKAVNRENNPNQRKSWPKKKPNLPSEIAHWTVDDFLAQPFGKMCVQKTGKVVHILEKNNLRHVGGKLKMMPDKNLNWALFIPSDSRAPRIMIPMNQCPPDFVTNILHYENALFMASIDDDWEHKHPYPRGRLQSYLGCSGEIEAETRLILAEHEVDDMDFAPADYEGIPGLETETWPLPEEEVASRRDFRTECVFTIDPATARDLDDALSIKELPELIDGKKIYEVGVHIADVSYFLKETMPLDETARQRTTSVYLVQKVIPMLPRILCEKHCSLTPGEDKLTFSVVWKMDEDGKVHEEWFGRTVINSCVKLSYEYAQDMLDAPNREWKLEELPQLFKEWTPTHISWSVNRLMDISRKLRQKRFDNGALKIDKLKISFVLDKETGLPTGFAAHLNKDSNSLVEELMLLANMSVADKIYRSFPEISFLRNHPPPDEKLLKEFQSFCEYNNFEVDPTNSGTLQRTLAAITEGNEDVSRVVSHFLLRSMKNAAYFCTGMKSSMIDFHHYALNVPFYTHFTSPIRRYPDVIVHRLLGAALGYRAPISEEARDLHRLAAKCNTKKMNARLVSDASQKIFLSLYIKETEPTEEVIVTNVLDKCFDALVLSYGQPCRVNLDQQKDVKSMVRRTVRGVPCLSVTWKVPDSGKTPQVNCDEEVTQEIKSCCKLRVQLHAGDPEMTKWTGQLLHPRWTP
ncbi:DIS3-like exonuclease 2 [Halotydeus destructor]|nr:DIS3-like exonuclease 2 [Halotydeus destructor]